MPAVARQGDLCTGHPPFPPRPSSSGANTVFANGIPVHCQGDAWPVHVSTAYPYPAHPGSLKAGSSTVFAEGKAMGRVGDPIDCGSKVAAGSPNVFAGG